MSVLTRSWCLDAGNKVTLHRTIPKRQLIKHFVKLRSGQMAIRKGKGQLIGHNHINGNESFWSYAK